MNKLTHPKHISFRLARVADSEFILSLRLNEHKNKYLSPVDNDLDAQKEWLLRYEGREREKKEFYYIIEGVDGRKLGAVRIYDFQGDSFCWGSWILTDDAPSYAAIESALFVYEVGFYQLGFKSSHFDVRKDNTKVFNFHRKFGAVVTREDPENYYLRISKSTYENTKTRYQKFFSTTE